MARTKAQDSTRVSRYNARKRAADPLWDRKNNLWAKYRITLEEFNAILELQEGVCFFCYVPAGKRSLSVDHDHVPAGKRSLSVDHDHACCPGIKSCGACIRGILCFHCNRWLSRMEPVARKHPTDWPVVIEYLHQRPLEKVRGDVSEAP